MFRFFDRDRSGGVSYEEMRLVAREFGLQWSDDEVAALMARYDMDNTDNLDYNTFVNLVMQDTWSGRY